MTNFKILTFSIVPAAFWVAAATSTGVPEIVAVPGGLLLVALTGGLGALTSASVVDPA